jgi:hypothetical protein
VEDLTENRSGRDEKFRAEAGPGGRNQAPVAMKPQGVDLELCRRCCFRCSRSVIVALLIGSLVCPSCFSHFIFCATVSEHGGLSEAEVVSQAVLSTEGRTKCNFDRLSRRERSKTTKTTKFDINLGFDAN